MKRGKPLARRTSLKRTPMRRSGKKSKYKRRERDWEFMRWARRQPCIVRSFMAPLIIIPSAELVWRCEGRVQADHAGRRGIGQKADDKTCISLCRKHHAARGDFTGAFKGWPQAKMREFLAWAIKQTQQSYQDYLAIRSYR